MNVRDRRELVWICTDVDGEIAALSSGAAALLGVVHGRGQNLFVFFADASQKTAEDAIAQATWPHRRSGVIEPLARGPVAVEYAVTAGQVGGVTRLFWFFDVARDSTGH
jgi:hypothetical protein